MLLRTCKNIQSKGSKLELPKSLIVTGIFNISRAIQISRIALSVISRETRTSHCGSPLRLHTTELETT